MTPAPESPRYLGRVLAPDGTPKGTCFQISPRVVVTAWHVLEDVGANEIGSSVAVDPLSGGGRVAAAVHAVDELHDVAVLLRQEPLPTSIVGLVPSDSVRPGTDIVITGVPQFIDRHRYQYTNATGAWQGGAMREDQVALGQLEASAVVPGMSGGPVRRLADDRVVGIVSARYNSPDQWMQNTVWAVRTEDVMPLLAGVSEVGFDTVIHSDASTVGRIRLGSFDAHYSNSVAPLHEGGIFVIPRELPRPPADFTGRVGELAMLRALFNADALQARNADEADPPAGWHGDPVVISSIDGMGGIGKSALAAHAASQLVDGFPDGQLYVNLQGATPGLAPLEPLEALGRMLRALGVDPAAIPTKVDEAAARFRSLAAERRLLVLLDDASSPEQVRPLLPGSPTCAVLVTSRQVLATLEGAHPVHLDVLPTEQALTLLGRIVGRERIAAEPSAAAEVVRLCARLPLAIRIAGARLAARPTWNVQVLADQLVEATNRLEELKVGELAVQASFDVSLHALQNSPDSLDRAAAAGFGLLSLPDGPDLSLGAATCLLDQPESATRTLLERLVDARLLETPRPGRYQFHDLVRLYARQHAAHKHPEPERLAALTRTFDFYTATAWHTLELLRPGDHRLTTVDPRLTNSGLRFADASTALAWLEAERANMLAAIAQTAEVGPAIPATLASQLTRALLRFFEVRGYWRDAQKANWTVLQLAHRVQDQTAEAYAHTDLGLVHWLLGRHEEAIASQQQSLTIFRELNDQLGQARSLTYLGLIYWRAGRYDEANVSHEESLAICREVGDIQGAANSLTFLGLVNWRLGRYDEAIACYQENLPMFQRLGDRWGQAHSLNNLGRVYERQGRYDEAITSHQESLAVFQRLGDRHGQAYSLTYLGIDYEGPGRYEEAIVCQQKGLAIRREMGDRHGHANSLNNLGRLYERMGRYEEAITNLQQSLSMFRELGDPFGQAEALRDLGDALQALGDLHQAQGAWKEALAIWEELRTPEADQVRRRLATLSFVATKRSENS
jgi:tetratricopeptide (TPR) repeat protein